MSDAIATLLSATPAFAQLPAEIRSRIALRMPLRTLAHGEVLAREGDPGNDLFLVLNGNLALTSHAANPTFDSPHLDQALDLGSAGPGSIVGESSLLTGHPNPATITATEPSTVACLSAADFDQLCSESPGEMAPTLVWMVERLDAYSIATAVAQSSQLSSLSSTARHAFALALTRIDVRAGQTLFHKGEPGNAIFLILSGRIRLMRTPESTSLESPSEPSEPAEQAELAELGKGDLFGELAMLTGEARSATAIAVRDSHLARLDRTAFDRLVAAHPTEILGLFARQLAGRLSRQNHARTSQSRQLNRPPVAIAILPLSPTEQTGSARDFAAELVRQLSAFGPTLHLSRTVVDRVFQPVQRRHSAQQLTAQVAEVAQRRLLAWLDDLERIYRHVVYEADYQSGFEESEWTSRCLRQADVLLVVAGGPADPHQSEQTMVRLNRKTIPSVKTTLILTHTEGPGSVTHTIGWKRALGFTAHEHVRRNSLGQHHPGDVGRIARALNGQSVGLVLGGGFALGLAHIGVVDAMRDLHIPIDFVGGTSMGAIIAAACAQEFTHDQMLEVMDHGCAQALKGDYTLPILSLLSGRKVTLALGKYLEKLDIEDLWLPYFAISASLVNARMVVHRQGSALKSVVASCRAPGMFPPLGWDGDVLVDGGLVNNIPADVMRATITNTAGAGTVFAVDVSPETEFTAGQEFGMEVSGWRVAARNFNPFRRQQKMGTLADVLMRLIRLGGVGHKQQIQDNADLYMTIPLDQFAIRDFHRGEEMSQIGYEHAKQQLESWIRENGRPWLGTAGQKS
jgi:predicted acylesterase/phospholipase RssA/CRP-like cAMP-binding protein